MLFCWNVQRDLFQYIKITPPYISSQQNRFTETAPKHIYKTVSIDAKQNVLQVFTARVVLRHVSARMKETAAILMEVVPVPTAGR